MTPVPASEHVLTLFCGPWRAREKLIIRLNLPGGGTALASGLRVGGSLLGNTPQLDLVLRGIKRRQGGPAPDRRLPITPGILRLLRAVWERAGDTWDAQMLWAASCCGFFGFMRSGEFTVAGEFDPSRHLSPADISVDSWSSPSWVCVHLKQSKTDPFRRGVDVHLRRTDSDLCPVGALLSYLVRRGWDPGPLFGIAMGVHCRGRRWFYAFARR